MRATLRELYGYVALLSGRDRRQAERLVGDVYRSLFRAARAGHVESVTLGALRSAARRAWLEEHRVELATTDEVSRAPVSTIAELSPLERVVLVLQHVNAMSTDRAAIELGRPEREVAAIGAHAVRRLRGTDDTSGAWLRAYLGPSVSPSAGLVDRIVEHLGESDETSDETGTESEVDTEETVAESIAATSEAELGVLADVGGEGGVEPVPADAPETTELAIVDRPTIELAAIAAPIDPALPLQTTDGVPTEPERSSIGDDVAEPGRPRWALVIGAVLLVALVVALVWLAFRGDPGDTIVSTPGTSAEVAGAEPASVGAAATTTTATTTTVATTDVATTVPAGPVELGFDPPCTDRTGAEPSALTWGDTFGPLGTEPALTVLLPESVDVAADPERDAAIPSTILRPDGLIVAVRPAEGHRGTGTIIARVGLDGRVAWVRCVDELVRIGTAPDVGVDLATRPVADGGTWSTLSIADGSDGDPLDAVQSGVIEAPTPSSDGGDGPTLGYSYDSDLGRPVIAGLDDGRILWTAPDVVLPDRDEFRAIAVDGTVLARSCVATDAGIDCAAGELRGYDLQSGELLWSRSGAYRVAAADDGFALVGDGTAWELVDARTGVAVGGQRWDDPDTFDVGDDADTGFVHQVGGAIVVAQPGTVSIWLPQDAAVDASEVAIL